MAQSKLYLRLCRRLRDDADKVRSARITDIIPLGEKSGGAHPALVEVEFMEGEEGQ
jgi:hypothetical protein